MSRRASHFDEIKTLPAPIRHQLRAAAYDKADKQTTVRLLNALAYTVLVLPIAVFFFSEHLFRYLSGHTDIQVTLWAAAVLSTTLLHHLVRNRTAAKHLHQLLITGEL